MTGRMPNSMMLLVLVALAVPVSHAQTNKPGPSVAVPEKAKSQAVTTGVTPAQTEAQAAPAQQTGSSGVLVDQVIAVVNGDLVLESDVEEERRFAAFQPFTAPTGDFSRERAIERLIDRTLILQQASLQPDDEVNGEEATAELNILRGQIPACKAAHCETPAGWERFVRDHGFTLPELTERWRQRMEILKFVQIRFQSGIDVPAAEVKAYYDKTLLPAYAKANVAPPKLETITDRIKEVLLQQQVSNLLGDWLKSLKAQGTVRVMKPNEAAL